MLNNMVYASEIKEWFTDVIHLLLLIHFEVSPSLLALLLRELLGLSVL